MPTLLQVWPLSLPSYAAHKWVCVVCRVLLLLFGCVCVYARARALQLAKLDDQVPGDAGPAKGRTEGDMVDSEDDEGEGGDEEDVDVVYVFVDRPCVRNQW